MSIKFHKMRFIKLTSLLLIFFFCAEIQGTFAQTSLFSYNHYVNENGDTLNYRLLFPDYNSMRMYPLVVFLHGSGERGDDNEAQLKWGMSEFADEHMMIQYPAFVIAPQCPSDMEWANYDEDETTMTMTLKPSPSKPMEMVIALIHQLITEFPIDTSRIYITGLSLGGHGTYDAIQRNPTLFCRGSSSVWSRRYFPGGLHCTYPHLDISWCGRSGSRSALFAQHVHCPDQCRCSSRIYSISRSGSFFLAGCLYRSPDAGLVIQTKEVVSI